jgi:hypothetical protein
MFIKPLGEIHDIVFSGQAVEPAFRDSGQTIIEAGYPTYHRSGCIGIIAQIYSL